MLQLSPPLFWAGGFGFEEGLTAKPQSAQRGREGRWERGVSISARGKSGAALTGIAAGNLKRGTGIIGEGKWMRINHTKYYLASREIIRRIPP